MTRLAVLGVLLLTVVSYAGVRHNGWVYEDAAMRDVAEHLEPSYSDGMLTRNLARFSVYATSRAFGPKPQAHHAVQLAIHLVNGLLVYALAVTVLPSVWALLAMAICLLHPIQVDAAAYVASRPDLLLTTWLLVALNLAVRPFTWLRGLGIGLAFFAGIASKQTAVIIAPLVLLAVWARRPKDRAGIAWEREGFAWAFAGMVMVGATLALQVPHDLDALPYNYIGTAAYQSAAFWRQVSLVVVPIGFTMDHNIGVTPPVVAGLSLLMVLSVAGWAIVTLWRGRLGMVPVLVLWPILMVAPRFLLSMPEFFNEHQFYPAMSAVALGVALLAKESYGLYPQKRRSDLRLGVDQRDSPQGRLDDRSGLATG